MKHAVVRPAHILLSACLLTACQSQSFQVIPMRFQLDSPATGGTVAAGQAPVASGQSVRTGTLLISFKELLADGLRQRRVLATVADVERVVVTVTAGSQVFSQTVERAAIAGGQVTATFTAIPTGVVSIAIKAYDATSRLIGETSRSANVSSNQTTTVNLPLVLSPTYLPVSGGGGTSQPPVGSLVTQTTITNGSEFHGTPTATVATRIVDYDLPGNVSAASPDDHAGLIVDTQGTVWIGGYGDRGEFYLQRIASDGTQTDLPPTFSYPFAVGPNGELWAKAPQIYFDAYVGRVALPLQSFTKLSSQFGSIDSLATDANGNCWVADQSSARCLSPGGQVVATFTPPGGHDRAVLAVAVGPDGDLWAHGGGGRLFRAAPDGTPKSYVSLPQVDVATTDLAIDSKNNAWFGRADKLYRVSAAGDIQSFDLGDRISISVTLDSQDRIWVWAPGSQAVLCYASDATLLATYKVLDDISFGTLPRVPNRIAAAPDGSIWYFSGYDRVSQLVP